MVVYRGRGKFARNMLRDLKRPERRVMMRFPIDHHILGFGLRNSANSVLYHHHHPGHYRTKKMFYDYHHITVVKNRVEQEKLFLKKLAVAKKNKRKEEEKRRRKQAKKAAAAGLPVPAKKEKKEWKAEDKPKDGEKGKKGKKAPKVKTPKQLARLADKKRATKEFQIRKKAFLLRKKQGRLSVKEKLWLLSKEDSRAALRLRRSTTKVIPIWWVPRNQKEKMANMKLLRHIANRKNAVLRRRREKRFVFFNTKAYILKKGSRKGLKKARDTFYRRLAQSNHAKKLNRLKKREEKAKAQGK